MTNFTALFLSLFPFVLFLYLLLWKKISLLWGSIFTLFCVFIFQIFYWKIIPSFLLTSFVKGTLVSLDIFFIILGAIFFLEIIKDIKIIDNIRFYLESFFKDYRVQVILLAWFFENFLEGTAGFGTPSTVVAPILVSLGIPTLSAVVLSLLGNSTSVAFGAAGTPIRVGFEGIDVANVPLYTSLFNSVGLLVPVFMLWTVTSLMKDKKRHFFEALPFAVWAGIAFVVPSILLVPLGQEFPSILGSLIGLFLVLITSRLGIFTPKNKRLFSKSNIPKIKLPLYKLIIPYLVLIVLLIVGKFTLGSVNLSFPWNFNYKFNLSNPGFSFLIAGIPTALFWGRKKLIFQSINKAFLKTLEPFVIIASMSIMVQLIILSGNNYSGVPSILSLMAKGFETKFLPLLSPFVGAFGSFLTGSATVSNLMFGNFLYKASQAISYDGAKILALALVGAAAGNMIALADVITAEAVVGLKDKTRQVLRGVIVPCFIYILLVGLIGLLLVRSS